MCEQAGPVASVSVVRAGGATRVRVLERHLERQSGRSGPAACYRGVGGGEEGGGRMEGRRRRKAACREKRIRIPAKGAGGKTESYRFTAAKDDGLRRLGQSCQETLQECVRGPSRSASLPFGVPPLRYPGTRAAHAVHDERRRCARGSPSGIFRRLLAIELSDLLAWPQYLSADAHRTWIMRQQAGDISDLTAQLFAVLRRTLCNLPPGRPNWRPEGSRSSQRVAQREAVASRDARKHGLARVLYLRGLPPL